MEKHMEKHSEKNYTISEMSKMFDLPGSTLRYYEQLGILPKVGRNASKQRVYNQCHVDRLSAICCFKRTGMSMARLQDFFKYEENQKEHMDEILELLAVQKQEMEDKIKQYQADLEHVKRKICFYSDKKKAVETNQEDPSWQNYEEERLS